MPTQKTIKNWVYNFDQLPNLISEVGTDYDILKSLLGGKGCFLADMTKAGLPVPPGLTITTQACNYYSENQKFPEGMLDEILASLKKVEQKTGKTFGGKINPLLVSCRSGAKFSMPGMMDTVLNLGLNEEIVNVMIAETNNPKFVWNCYRRLIQMFGSVVLNIPDEPFEEHITAVRKARGVDSDVKLEAADWQQLAHEFLKIIESFGQTFPADPFKQLEMAIQAVFASWNGKRAIDYRRAEGIPDDLGTAVNIQTMIFGNINDNCGTGVAFTRNPATGVDEFFGDFLVNAQGEDVVAGIRNPQKISELANQWPEIYQQLLDVRGKLESYYRDMQDIEFTIVNGKLWMLQTRTGKRTAKAAIKMAVDMAEANLITKQQAMMRVTPKQIDMMLHPQFSEEEKEAAKKQGRLLATGVNASPGAACGVLVFDADKTEEFGKTDLGTSLPEAIEKITAVAEKLGIKLQANESILKIKYTPDGKIKSINPSVIMIRPETKPDDVHGMLAASAILTALGGATSHAAVVSRGFGIPCVCGCDALRINLSSRTVEVGDKIFSEGDLVSLDGGDGQVFSGALTLSLPDFAEQKDLQKLLLWADEICADPKARGDKPGLQVWTNADQPADAQIAKSFGAQGIGLCRTEHMFFAPERLPIVQKMILASDAAARQPYLDQLLPEQQKDFEGLFEVMDNLPVIIRLIDPPMHEFLPPLTELLVEVEKLKIADPKNELGEKQKLLAAVTQMHEANPMMGLRGIRLGLMMPELIAMQVKAIMQAACSVAKKGITVKPEIMIPLVSHINELKKTRETLAKVAKEVVANSNVQIAYKFGTMIEIPRAALTAGEIATEAEFFSFGTNDLTQMTFGFSRDDAERGFLLRYVEEGILPESPFQTIDTQGVGRLIELAVSEGRKTNPNLEIGICGEHGGDPASITFCHTAGLNYVSCSPFRVPVARLAAAQAVLNAAK
ncbi:MAG: putative PEP-binding protein [Candidatus Buchananbacteria bacterium]